jgi:serine/threonine-protein kinase
VVVDHQLAWDVEHDGKSIQVQAGAYHGRPVFFEVLAPWAQPPRVESVNRTIASKFAGWTFVGIAVGLELFCLVLARRNLRLGRGDTKGALRVAMFLFAVWFVSIALSSHYSSNVWWTWSWWQATVGLSTGIGIQFSILYVALEPYIRRSWPEVLISWSRLLEGNLKDPLVGRDVLLGILFGVGMAAVNTLDSALPYWYAIKGRTPFTIPPSALGGVSVFSGYLINHLIDVLMNSVGSLALILLVWRLTRSKVLAIAILALAYIMISLTGENLWFEVLFASVSTALVLFCLVRIGLLPTVFAWFAYYTLRSAPTTFDFSRWYAGWGAGAVLIVLAFALYGFRTSLGGRPLFGTTFED